MTSTNSISFKKRAVFAALAVAVSITAVPLTVGDAAAYDRNKYDQCVKNSCEHHAILAAENARNPDAAMAHSVAYNACIATCRAMAENKEKPKESPVQPKVGAPSNLTKDFCGAYKQRPCKLWERIPSCNKGLKEMFIGKNSYCGLR